jgi:hypothetical protein
MELAYWVGGAARPRQCSSNFSQFPFFLPLSLTSWVHIAKPSSQAPRRCHYAIVSCAPRHAAPHRAMHAADLLDLTQFKCSRHQHDAKHALKHTR